jgi:hypothetical protein
MDLCMEFDGKLFVFAEIKLRGSEPPRGQELFLERLCDSIQTSTRACIILVAHHDVHDTRRDVDAAALIVSRYYWQKKWTPPNTPISIKKAIDVMVARIIKGEALP